MNLIDKVKIASLPGPTPDFLVRFHFVAMCLWVLVTPYTASHPESVLWVAVMSQYANFVGHFASWDAARSERTGEERLDELHEEIKLTNKRLAQLIELHVVGVEDE